MLSGIAAKTYNLLILFIESLAEKSIKIDQIVDNL